MDELVSVIVPVYKVEPYLQKCMDSIVHQTYDHLQIILIDDGSPDRCGEMCDQMASQDERISVIHQANQGLSAARNRGIDLSQGEYILFVDSDDYIEPNTVECLLRASLNTHADVTCCGVCWENGKDSVSKPLTGKVECYRDTEILKAAMNERFASFAWNKLWKRELFTSDCRFPVGRYFEDHSATWKIFDKCHIVTCVPEVLFHYLIRKDSISNMKSMKNLTDRWIAFRERYDALSSRSEEFRQICVIDCLETIAYTWRWLHDVPKSDRISNEQELVEMQRFAASHKDMIRNCSLPARICLFSVLHSNKATIALSYYLNQFYRRVAKGI